MKINLQDWHGRLSALFETSGISGIEVSSDPMEFFDGFFCDAGFPEWSTYPIWRHEGIVIFIEKMPLNRFESAWCCESTDECRRIFWVSNTGILGEVSDDDGSLTDFFPVASAYEVVQFLKLLHERKLTAPVRHRVKNHAVGELIEDVYVRYFRYPDELSQNHAEMPWVPLEYVKGLVTSHVERNIRWLDLPFRDDQFKGLLRKYARPSNEFSHDPVSPVGDNPSQGQPLGDFLRDLHDALSKRDEDLLRTYFEVAAKIPANAFLPPSAAEELVSCHLPYAFDGRYYGFSLELGVKLTEVVFPGYLHPDYNLAAYTKVSSCARALATGGPVPDESITIELPAMLEQKRFSFEVRSLRHAIRRKAARLEDVQSALESTSSPDEVRRFLAARLNDVSEIARSTTKLNAEIERAKRPLPFFIECILLGWERSARSSKVPNGFASFGNLLRVISLLGLAELQSHQRRSSSLPAPLDVMKGISGNPSIGHWSKLVDFLAAQKDGLPFFGAWLGVLAVHRKAAIELIELRNSYAHPSSAIEQSMLDEICTKLSFYFDEVQRGLRSKAPACSAFLPQSRKSVRAEAQAVCHQVTGLNLNSSYASFTELVVNLPGEKAQHLIDDEVAFVSLGDDTQWLSVNRFFKISAGRPGEFDFLIYDKGYDGTVGLFTGINTGRREKLHLGSDAFSI